MNVQASASAGDGGGRHLDERHDCEQHGDFAAAAGIAASLAVFAYLRMPAVRAEGAAMCSSVAGQSLST